MTCFKRCSNDDDYAKISIFLLKNKRELHPAFTTMDMVPMIYSYVTKGYLLQAVDANNRIIGATAYYRGTPEQEFKDSEVAFIDIVIFKRTYRGTRLFLNGLHFLVNHIKKEHPEVVEIRLAALEEDRYLSKLYSKFMNATYSREGMVGKEIIFCEKIEKISTFLNKFNKV